MAEITHSDLPYHNAETEAIARQREVELSAPEVAPKPEPEGEADGKADDQRA